MSVRWEQICGWFECVEEWFCEIEWWVSEKSGEVSDSSENYDQKGWGTKGSGCWRKPLGRAL